MYALLLSFPNFSIPEWFAPIAIFGEVGFLVLFAVIAPRRVRRRHQEVLRAAQKSTSTLPDWRTDQVWRQPTDIRFFEVLKSNLLFRENTIEDRDAKCAALLNKENHLSGGSDFFTRCQYIWFVVWSVDWALADSYFTETRDLVVKIDCIWMGNAHLEIGDCQEQIKRLNRSRQDVPDDYQKVDKLRSIDDKITRLERQLNDLQEIVRRAQTRTKAEAEQATEEAKAAAARKNRSIDIQDDIHKNFVVPEHTKMEAAKWRDILEKQYRDNSHLTEVEKERLIEGLHAEFNRLYGKDPAAAGKKGVPIYRKEA